MTEEKTQEALLLFCDALESAVTQLRQSLGSEAKKDLTKLPFDAEKIHWKDAQGTKGPYQFSDDYGSADHQALLKMLVTAGGKMNSDIYFYWQFQNEMVIGRKMRKKKT